MDQKTTSSPPPEKTTSGVDSKDVFPLRQSGQDWLDSNHIKAFYSVARSSSQARGAQNAVELSGLGKLSPNMMLVGFRESWTEDKGRTEDYFQTLLTAFEMRLAVGVLRVPGGLDVSDSANITNRYLRGALLNQQKYFPFFSLNLEGSLIELV